jgi:AcrR family transcriptional regulator
MSGPDPKEAHVSTKQQIADVFAKTVARVGYAKANLDDVSRELHISKKTIYVHFDGKRDIYAFVVEQQAALEKARMKAELAKLPSNSAKVEALVAFVIGQGRSHVEETSRAEWLQEFEVAADAFRAAHGDLIREVVAEGISADEFAAGDPVLVEKIVGAMVLEYLVIVNADPSYDRDAELVERILRFVG